MVLNNVFMTAELSRLAADAPAANVEVMNYSEVARDAATQASQAGVALRTAGEVKTVLQSLYAATKDAVRAAYGEACVADPVSGGKPPGCAYSRADEGDDKLRTVLRASQPRINAVAEFFTFTYGRNLQVDGKRPYYAGIGFGFVQVAQELAKLAKK